MNEKKASIDKGVVEDDKLTISDRELFRELKSKHLKARLLLEKSNLFLVNTINISKSKHALFQTLDDKLNNLLLANYDLYLDLIKNVFIVSFTGYLTTLAIPSNILSNLLLLQYLLPIILLISVVLGVVIICLRNKKIKLIIKKQIDMGTQLENLLNKELDALDKADKIACVLIDAKTSIDVLEAKYNFLR